MGTADRDYSQEGRSRPKFLGSIPPVIRWILIANVVIFLLDVFNGFALSEFGAFSIRTGIFEGRIWEFFTFQFLHAHVAHVLFNCIGLYFFGPIMERWWGSRKFLIFYLLSGASGAAFFTLLAFAGVLPGGLGHGLVGASAGLYGILIGVAVHAPAMRIQLLFPPIEMTMRTLAIGVLVIAVGSIALKLGGNEGGEAGHLGGAIVGFLLVKFPKLLAWAQPRDPDMEIIRPKAFSRKSEAKIRPRSRVDLKRTTEVDAILDKISREGIHSMTDEDREVLARASKSNDSK